MPLSLEIDLVHYDVGNGQKGWTAVANPPLYVFCGENGRCGGVWRPPSDSDRSSMFVLVTRGAPVFNGTVRNGRSGRIPVRVELK